MRRHGIVQLGDGAQLVLVDVRRQLFQHDLAAAEREYRVFGHDRIDATGSGKGQAALS